MANTMTIDIKKLGKLARIKLSDDEAATYEKEVESILGWIEQLSEVDTEGVRQLSSVSKMTLRWREDKVTDGGQVDAVLANAPDKDFGCFAVPKVIE